MGPSEYLDVLIAPMPRYFVIETMDNTTAKVHAHDKVRM